MPIPLAERLRPKTLEEWVGHSQVVAPGKPLFEAIKNDRLFSFILYAPPGSGKTTLCQLVKKYSKNRFRSLSAVTAGVKDIKGVIEEAKMWKLSQRQDSILFIDEIHRFNKSQQDALLPAVEVGDIILIGATTENPSFELNSALLSRARVFRLESLETSDLKQILSRANRLTHEESLNAAAVDDLILEEIAARSQGDARVALNAFELILFEPTMQRVQEIFQSKILFHDKAGDAHYQVVSAFIKSMRASQTDAALYYLARMWAAGEDPLFIARRMLIFASEDIGNTDLRAIALANAVRSAVEFVGRPECFYALSQGVIYLSRASKSREAGDLFSKAMQKVEKFGSAAVPSFLVNANTKLDRELGRGRARENEESYLPDEVDADPNTG